MFLAFASIVIPGFSLEIHEQDFYSLLDMYMFRTFTQTEGSSQCQQQPFTGPCPELDERRITKMIIQLFIYLFIYMLNSTARHQLQIQHELKATATKTQGKTHDRK
jgi:hypothetical protein